MPLFRASQFRRIALRATGGKVKAIFWHLGVRCALEERGFRFTSGFGPRADPEPGEIGVLVGSSAGSIFSILVAAGYDVPDIMQSFLGRKSKMPPILSSTIFHRHIPTLGRYFRRIHNAVNLRAGEELFPGTGLRQPDDTLTSEPELPRSRTMTTRRFLRYFRAGDLLAIRAPYVLDGMEAWLHSLMPDHDRFEDLRARLFILASDLDATRTAVFAAEDGDHLWYRYLSGVPISRAAICSMAIPSVFNSVSVRIDGRKRYFIDGDVYNPTETMVESDHRCDLAIVSSFEAPYRFHPAIGSLHHLGLPYEITQTIALTIYSRLMQGRKTTRAKVKAMEIVRDILSHHLDEATLEQECERIAAALELSLEMKTVFLHPYSNPLLFFGNPFDLSPRMFAKILVEATIQASELLEREGFVIA
jgi:predicted acylesterase/phospholipase RssA